MYISDKNKTDLQAAPLVQGVKDRIGLKSSDVGQGMKSIHGQFHILN